jgi:glycosyltransferase involved in cell wall biosynthesis
MSLKISIIVPCLNVEKTIRETLDSILIQKFKDFEVIIVDNLSDDKTHAIALEYVEKDSRFKLLLQNKRVNMSDNVSTGFKAAKGEWLMFLPADDCLYENALEELNKLTLLYFKATIALGQFSIINNASTVLKKQILFKSKFCRRYYIKQKKAFRIFSETPMGEACSSIIRKDIAEKEGLMPSQFERLNGWDLYSRIAANGGIAVSGKLVGKYRIHEGISAYKEEVHLKTIEERFTLLELQKDYFDKYHIKSKYYSSLVNTVLANYKQLAVEKKDNYNQFSTIQKGLNKYDPNWETKKFWPYGIGYYYFNISKFRLKQLIKKLVK